MSLSSRKSFVLIGFLLIVISQALMSFGYDFLMNQKPFDYAHWSLLIGAMMLLHLWTELPHNITKNVGLYLMTIGVLGVAGMCTIDFILWSAHQNQTLKGDLLNLIYNSPSIRYPFLMIGPSLFYIGLGVSTYGLFKKAVWQVILINLGGIMIGLGHLILHNQVIPVIGSLLLFLGFLSILSHSENMKSQ